VLLAAVGCSAHSPYILKNTTDAESVGSSTYAPHSERVFVTATDLDSSSYEVIAFLEVGRV